MTPISFALEILLDCETIEEAHKKCRKYIKTLESGQSPTKHAFAHLTQQVTSRQAPSTQALLAKQEAAIQAAEAAGIVAPPPAVLPPRIVGGEVQTGNGTRGPRKF